MLGAGVAAADVSIGGDANMGVVYDGNDTNVNQSVRLTFSGMAETDHGIAMTGFFRMTDGEFDRRFVRVSSEGLTLTVGSTNGAIRSLARTSFFYGYDRGGFAVGDTTIGTHTDAADNVVYASYAIDSFTVGASTDYDGTNSEIAASYSMDGFTIGAGFGTGEIWAVRGAYSMEGLTVSVGYNSNEVLVAGASYTMDDITVGAALQNSDAGTKYGAQASYSLGGGASITGALFRNEQSSNQASFGLSFSF